MFHRSIASLVTIAACGAIAVGCNTHQNGPSEASNRAYLTRAANCEDLLSMLKADALLKMNARIDREIRYAGRYDYWGIGGGFDADETTGSTNSGGAGGGVSTPNGPPQNEGNASNPDSNQGSDNRANEHSDTNKQVDDVDEADFVKTDGKHIFLLHGQNFLVLNAWPASDLAQQSSFAIEGTPSEMFVTDEGQVVVYSMVGGTPIYEAAGLSPRGYYSDTDGITTSPGDYYYSDAYSLTKITVLSLDNNAEPSIEREMYFEGGYSSSRRVGQYVRTVLHGPAFGPSYSTWPDTYISNYQDFVTSMEQLRIKNTQIINESTTSDWLPYYMVRANSGIEAHLNACEDFYVPTAGTTEYGVTQIQSIDLAAPHELPKSATIVGATQTVYSNKDTMVLAARAWINIWDRFDDYDGSDDDVEAVSIPPSANDGGSAGDMGKPVESGSDIGTSSFALQSDFISTAYTHLHAFDLTADPSQPIYTASGTIPGNLKDQFSIDVDGTNVRVAVTDNQATFVADHGYNHWSWSDTNHVFVLEPHNGDLLEVGSYKDFARTESIYAVRFVDQRAYVVTFLITDPLFVFDLSDPTNPIKLGQLEIPGFSEYMHPIGDNLLLTIGRNGNNLMLQIFDVSNAAAPLQKYKYEFIGEYGYSEAEHNHKAFTYFASRELLTFPYGSYGPEGQVRSSLKLFDIKKNAGIFPRGTIDHSDLFGGAPHGYCNGYFGNSVRRGLFLDDYVYSISYGGVKVHQIDNLGTEAAPALSLPPPTNPDYYGCNY